MRPGKEEHFWLRDYASTVRAGFPKVFSRREIFLAKNDPGRSRIRQMTLKVPPFLSLFLRYPCSGALWLQCFELT